jgi:hypothetical protein
MRATSASVALALVVTVRVQDDVRRLRVAPSLLFADRQTAGAGGALRWENSIRTA